MRKYEIGKRINNEWAIIATLETRKQNKKILAFNLESFQIKEGWIWDFTRGLITDKPNKKMFCKGFTNIIIPPINMDEIIFRHFELSNVCYYKHNWLTREEFGYLQSLREGSYTHLSALLKKFDWLLYKDNTNNTEKQEVHNAKNSKKLATLIQLTYILLAIKGKID